MSELIFSQTNLSVRRMCELAQLSRSNYYRALKRPPHRKAEVESELSEQVEEIALEWPSYGYRRIQKEMSRRGQLANHKRVLRLMRERGLLCKRKRRYTSTTDSEHCLPVYPNLTKELVL